MKDCEKTFIVYYINISSMDPSRVPNKLSEMAKEVDALFDDSVKVIVVAVHSGENHIDVIRHYDNLISTELEEQLKSFAKVNIK